MQTPAVLGAWLQGEDRNFGRAAEAEWQIDRADASIDVELHSVAQPEKPLNVFGSHLREKERGQERETNLASVGMTGENEVDPPSDSTVGEIGLVSQQDKRFLLRVPAGRESGGEVGPPLESILDAGEPQAPPPALKGQRTVCQHGNAMGQKGVGDRVGADQDVVVAQDRIAQRAFDPAKEFGAVVTHPHSKMRAAAAWN